MLNGVDGLVETRIVDDGVVDHIIIPELGAIVPGCCTDSRKHVALCPRVKCGRSHDHAVAKCEGIPFQPLTGNGLILAKHDGIARVGVRAVKSVNAYLRVGCVHEQKGQEQEGRMNLLCHVGITIGILEKLPHFNDSLLTWAHVTKCGQQSQ